MLQSGGLLLLTSSVLYKGLTNQARILEHVSGIGQLWDSRQQ